MTQVIDFGKSVVSSFSQSISIPIAGSPSSNTLTVFGLATAQAGNVILNASVGVQTVQGNLNFLFSILRGNTTILQLWQVRWLSICLSPIVFRMSTRMYQPDILRIG